MSQEQKCTTVGELIDALAVFHRDLNIRFDVEKDDDSVSVVMYGTGYDYLVISGQK